MANSILFITTSSLAANPRLVKEIEVLKNSYSCTVICYKHDDWSLELSQRIMSNNKDVRFIEIDRNSEWMSTIMSKLKHKLSVLLNPILKSNIKISAFASNDKSVQIMKFMSFEEKYEHIIAHNLGAFYPAVKLAKKLKVTLQLDIEDYYPGEALYFNKSYEKENRNRLMQYSLKNATSITYASKGIAMQCKKQYVIPDSSAQITIINAFKSDDFPKPSPKKNERLKAVWFSQNIGPNRGLESVFEAAKVHFDFEFHLIGNSNKKYIESIIPSPNVIFHEILPQWELHQLLSEMDIGLALESKDADFNRDICLTNKFLAYAQAGLYILATDTFGQRDFLKDLHYNAGEIITNLSDALNVLPVLEIANEQKIKRWEKAKTFGWEKEQLKLKQLLY
ncbi:hypothetical protein [Winogradskyella flava]|uniref:Uncharacterized protein n=1 Tax=Winogradskyella flava TaxID=1884876 RepID=A0A842IST7_9FLAO|nr:hypothetical protein [Winogradskyella flava]MBC2844487.1 hypothetical protein [Winogradskyella flava]